MSRAPFVVVLASLLAAAVSEADPSPSLQLGTLPHRAGEAPWRIAVPIDDVVVAFDASDVRLAVRPSPVDDRAWLVFTANGVGPASGLLRVRDADGGVRAIAVAADVADVSEFDGLLLRGTEPGDVIERYLRPGDARIDRIDLARARIATVSAASATTGPADDDAGWLHVRVQLQSGVGECDGVLRGTDARGPVAVPVHVSLLESITVLGGASLATGFVPRRVRPIEERLLGSRYAARVGILGRRGDMRLLRILAATADPEGLQLTTRGFFDVAEGPSPTDRVHLSRLRHLGGDVTGSRLLTLSPGQAAVFDPIEGLVARHTDPLLARLGAACSSRLARNRVFAITGDGGGEWFLASFRARQSPGGTELRGTRYEPSLQELLGRPQLFVGDLAPIRYRLGARLHERLLVGVGTESGQLRLVELARNGATIAGRVRHALEVGDPSVLPDVRLTRLPSRRVGSAGLPARVRVIVPRQELRVLSVNEPGSWTRLGRESIGSTAAGTGVALARQSFLIGGPDGRGGTDLIRYAVDGGALVARALGSLPEVAARHYRASGRREHAWLVGTDPRGGGQVRFVTNGLAAGTNLPPIVDAGADFRTTESRVRLRARPRDANGDPISVRWFGEGVEFTDRFARRTFAFVRPGRTQVGVMARESGVATAGIALEDVDALVVRFDDVLAADSGDAGTAGLATALGRPEPNPASAHTTLPFTLASGTRVRIDVFDVTGRRVRELLDDHLGAGGHDVAWDGALADGTAAPNGVYWVRLRAGDRSSERRVVLTR